MKTNLNFTNLNFSTIEKLNSIISTAQMGDINNIKNNKTINKINFT